MILGFVPYDFVKKINWASIADSAIHSRQPVLLDVGSGFKYRRLIIGVQNLDYRHNHFITLVELNHAFGPYDSELMQHIAHILYLNNRLENHYVYLQSDVREHFILSLLQGKIFDAITCKDRLESINWSVKQFKYLMFIKPDNEIASEKKHSALLPSLRQDFSIKFPWTSSLIFENGILVFLDFEDQQSIYRKYDNFATFLRLNNLVAGISSMFENILKLRNKCEEAIQSALTGLLLHLPEKILPFKDVYFYNLLCSIKKHELINSFCVFDLDKLKQDDLKNGTDFFNTLKRYSLKGCNIKKVSDEMYLHRNTVSYRVSKACEILDVDIDSAEDIAQLFISFKIMELKEMDNDLLNDET